MTLAPAKMACVGRKRRPPKKNPRTMRERFAANLHRLAKDSTNAEIALACGVSRSSVSHWFSGIDMPDIDVWPALAKCLGVTVQELIS